jgi:hypothetical protein
MYMVGEADASLATRLIIAKRGKVFVVRREVDPSHLRAPFVADGKMQPPLDADPAPKELQW